MKCTYYLGQLLFLQKPMYYLEQILKLGQDVNVLQTALLANELSIELFPGKTWQPCPCSSLRALLSSRRNLSFYCGKLPSIYLSLFPLSEQRLHLVGSRQRSVNMCLPACLPACCHSRSVTRYCHTSSTVWSHCALPPIGVGLQVALLAIFYSSEQ